MATVLITGTNKGVGLELVKIYAARGDTVIATCRDPESASALSEVGGAVEVLGVSVGDDASVASLRRPSRVGLSMCLLIMRAPRVLRVINKPRLRWISRGGRTHSINSMAPVRVMQALLQLEAQALQSHDSDQSDGRPVARYACSPRVLRDQSRGE